MRILLADLPRPVRAVLLDDTCVVNSTHGTARSFVVVHADMLRSSAVSMTSAFGIAAHG